MVTGIECAGLVLAVLPLVVGAAKAYESGVDACADIVLQYRRDKKLQEFYEEFYWATVELNLTLRTIVDQLPGLTPERKVELLTVAEDWTDQADVTAALKSFFATLDDFDAFIHVMTKLVSLLAKLVKDKTVHITASDTMHIRLKEFAADRESHQTSARFLERFRFWKREEHRNGCLIQLNKWNKRLLLLIKAAPSQVVATTTIGQPETSKQSRASFCGVPTSQLRRLSQLLYGTLSRYWDCCAVRHQAKICMKFQENGSSENDNIAEFDFLVSSGVQGGTQWTWQEGYVVVRSDCNAAVGDREALNAICDCLDRGSNGHQLCLLVEDLNGCQKLWKLQPRPRTLHIDDGIPAISLQNLIQEGVKLSLRDKRRLAFIFAYSVLQYHGSEWLPTEWGKYNISFLYSSRNRPDLQRPYLSTCFDKCQPDTSGGNTPGLIRNPSIIALGILLIELDLGNPIEHYRAENEVINALTDLIVANRVLDSMDQCSYHYKMAIKACFDIPWLLGGQKVSLEDEETRDGLYTHVIRPLEEESKWVGFTRQ